jgi:hypothetical protein
VVYNLRKRNHYPIAHGITVIPAQAGTHCRRRLLLQPQPIYQITC